MRYKTRKLIDKCPIHNQVLEDLFGNHCYDCEQCFAERLQQAIQYDPERELRNKDEYYETSDQSL